MEPGLSEPVVQQEVASLGQSGKRLLPTLKSGRACQRDRALCRHTALSAAAELLLKARVWHAVTRAMPLFPRWEEQRRKESGRKSREAQFMSPRIWQSVCLSLHVNMCACVCACMCTGFTCPCFHVYVCACFHVCVHVYACICACMCMCVHVSRFVCAHARTCLYLHAHVSVSACECKCPCLRVHISMYACSCVYVSVYACSRVYMYLCLCVHMRPRPLRWHMQGMCGWVLHCSTRSGD